MIEKPKLDVKREVILTCLIYMPLALSRLESHHSPRMGNYLRNQAIRVCERRNVSPAYGKVG